jgi:transposase
LIERFPVNISTIAHCFDIKPRTLFLWYKDVISNYHSDKQSGQFAGKKVVEADEETGEVLKEQVVHISNPHHVGESMCIDEKMINGKYCTILSNHHSGHIALLLDSVKPSLVKQAIEQLGQQTLSKIQYINADMSPVMKKIGLDTMPHAKIVVDKFHVLKHAYDALQSVRLDIKKSLKTMTTSSTSNPNGWTDIELLEKTKYLLYKPLDLLDNEQSYLLNTVLEKYPLLHQAYHLMQEFAQWYRPTNIGKPIHKIKEALREWKHKVKQTGIKAFKQIVKMIENHQEEILRYFEKGLTNAKAENINARIQRFIINNYGTRNKDFFFYRLQVYFSPAPQKKI